MSNVSLAGSRCSSCHLFSFTVNQAELKKKLHWHLLWLCAHLLKLHKVKHERSHKKGLWMFFHCHIGLFWKVLLSFMQGFLIISQTASRLQITGTPSVMLSTFYLSNRKSPISFSQCAWCISILYGTNVSAFTCFYPHIYRVNPFLLSHRNKVTELYFHSFHIYGKYKIFFLI